MAELLGTAQPSGSIGRVLSEMQVIYVDSMDEVLKVALEREIVALPLTPVAPQVEAAVQHSEEKLH